MGGAYRRGEGKQFFHVSSGSLKKSTGKKDEEGKPVYDNYDGYEGQLTGIERFTDDFEGKTQEKIRITMKSETRDNKTGDMVIEVADITMTAETFYVVGLFSRLINVELDAPFLMGVLPSDQNSKVSFAFVKQFGKKIEKDKDFPQPEKIDLGGGKFAYKYTKTTEKVSEMISEINEWLKAKNEEEPIKTGEKEAF